MQPSKIVKFQQITLATLVAGASFTVQGAGFYVGAGALGSQLEPSVDGTTFTVAETQSSGARVIAGLDLSPRFTLEGYYSELGAATLSNQTVSGEIDYTAAGISGLYYLYSSRGSDGLMNREGLMLYGKAGLGEVTTDESNFTGVVEPAAVPDTDADGVLDDVDLCADTLVNAIVDDSGCVFTGILQGLKFGSGSAALSSTAAAALDNAIVELSANPALRISVQSHTDNRGNAANNMELSRLRAVTVVRYLSDVGGINLSRMEAVGYGESRPLQSNRTEQGRTANRRVEIEIIK